LAAMTSSGLIELPPVPVKDKGPADRLAEYQR
jgi:hypothetical protein